MRRIFGIMLILHVAVLIVRFSGAAEDLDDFWFTPSGKILSGVTLACGIIAAFYFAVDSLRREYRENRELAVAVAMVGVLSIGFVTVVYYLIWGWRPLQAEFGHEFCQHCVDETEEFTGDISLLTIDFVNGGRLLGSSEKCPDCGSEVKTHCFFVFGIPLFSKGSFRVLIPERDHVILRRRPFFLPHLLQILLVPTILICLFAATRGW